MLRLDHFVVHIDQDLEGLKQLKHEIEPLGLPYQPLKGKRTKGFQVSNIWIGDQYFELIWLKKRESDWRQEWVKRYNTGERGIFGLMLLTDDLDALQKLWVEQGIDVREPERISFKWLGIFKKEMPFRTLYTPIIPGTSLQIAVGQMDSEHYYRTIRRFMKPNAEENGITGIKSAVVSCDFSEDAWEYVQKLFPEAQQKPDRIDFNMGTTSLSFVRESKEDLLLTLHAETEQNTGRSFQIENVRVNL